MSQRDSDKRRSYHMVVKFLWFRPSSTVQFCCDYGLHMTGCPQSCSVRCQGFKSCLPLCLLPANFQRCRWGHSEGRTLQGGEWLIRRGTGSKHGWSAQPCLPEMMFIFNQSKYIVFISIEHTFLLHTKIHNHVIFSEKKANAYWLTKNNTWVNVSQYYNYQK